MFKRLFIIVFLLIVIITVAVYVYRYQLIQYSAEAFIRKALPPYVKIDKIVLDSQKGRIAFSGFKIINPPRFSDRYMVDIEEVSAKYRMRGKNLLDGLEILEPSIEGFILNIERRNDAKTNLGEMKNVVEKISGPAPAKDAARETVKAPSMASRMLGGRKPSDMIKLPQSFSVKDAKIIFIDRLAQASPRTITLENINTVLSLMLDENYMKVLKLASTGEGFLNGNRNEAVKWEISLDPTTQKLTMSNRFDVSGLDLLAFEPYYDRYSPFIFKKGRFSGTLVFDFDNGNIGSMNEIHLSDIMFYIKRGYENALFWETTVPDLAKYFTSPYGDIVFDFKIKGDMANPKFYLGPISKQALTSMAVDKISEIVQEVAKPKGGVQGAAGAPKSDIEKAKEYIELFKGLIKKE